MVWICSPSAKNCIVKFYSISADLKVLNEGIFSFLVSISPGVWTMIIVISIASFILALILSVKMVIKRTGDLYGSR